MGGENKNSLSGFQLYIQLKDKKQISTDKLFLLLENIGKEGSISKAATDMKVSYRYAWGLINDAEEFLDVKLLNKKIGGPDGGGATLTKEGKDMLGHYQVIRDAVNHQLNALITSRGDKRESLEEVTKEDDFLKYILIASTMEPVETGLLDVLEQVYFKKTGVLVRHIGVGSGKALQIAESGSVDLVLVHCPSRERSFVEKGHGILRKEFMSNRYYLVGPKSDPAGLGYIKVDAGVEVFFRQIALTDSVFISRGDHSGTHEKEEKLWEKAGVQVEDRNIVSGGNITSNLDNLKVAFEKNAYTLVDSTSYEMSEYRDDMIVFAGENPDFDPDLANVFSLIVVNKGYKDPSKNQDAIDFATWLGGKEGKEIIGKYPDNKGKNTYFKPL